MKKWIFCILCATLMADKAPVVIGESANDLPWFTGPLIAPSTLALKRGQINVEPYIFATANTGAYNSDWEVRDTPTYWSINFAPLMYFGLNDFIDLALFPSVLYNICEDQKNWALGEFNFGFDFQLYEDEYFKYDWYPNIKLSLTENFPVGKYDNLKPNKRRTEIGTNGSFETVIQLLFGKLVRISGVHYFSNRLALTYTVPAPVKVRGFNAYGGGYGCVGKVYPAQSFEIDYGFELGLSRNWVFAGDVIGIWSKRTRFKGMIGTNADGSRAKIGPGSGFQFSLAPALEYNWNANIGLIFGLQFTAAGRNVPQFYSGIIALNYFK